MKEYKIVRLSWVNGENAFAIMYRTPGSGWTYLLKYLNRAAAEKLLSEV